MARFFHKNLVKYLLADSQASLIGAQGWIFIPYYYYGALAIVILCLPVSSKDADLALPV